MKNVMVLDDSADIRKICEHTLKAEGFGVRTVSSASDALKLASIEVFDLFVVDVVLPESNGFEFLRTLRSGVHVDSPVIMLTGKKNPADVQKAIELGACDYVCKPFDRDIFISKIQTIFAGETHVEKISFTEMSLDIEAEIKLEGHLLALSESGVRINSVVPLQEGMTLKIASFFFLSLGIEPPVLKVLSCENTKSLKFPYQLQLSFVGISDESLTKIRSWNVRERAGRR